MANHSDPESCVTHREVCGEALAGETDRPAIEPRNQEIGMPTELTISEGHMGHGGNRKSCPDPARSETLRMSGSDLHGSWEVSAVPGATRPGGAGKVNDRNPVIHAVEKSDTPVVPAEQRATCGGGGGKGRSQGECWRDPCVPDTEPGKRIDGT